MAKTVNEGTGGIASLSGLYRLSCGLLESGASEDRNGNVLILAQAALEEPDCSCLTRDEHSFGIALNLIVGATQSGGRGEWKLESASNALPFQDEVFRSVVLYFVTDDGNEPELEEACRVLAPDGELLILGLNRRSWSGLKSLRKGPVPALRTRALKERLTELGMHVDKVLGAGLMGHSRPMIRDRGLSRICLPFADLLLVRARHRERPNLTLMRIKEFSAGAVPTTLYSG